MNLFLFAVLVILLSSSVIKKALRNLCWRWLLLLCIINFPSCLPAVCIWALNFKLTLLSWKGLLAFKWKWGNTSLFYNSNVLYYFSCLLEIVQFTKFTFFSFCGKFPSEWSLNSTSLLISRSRPVITMNIAIFLPMSINITAPQCHDGLQPVNCLNVTACFRFSGKEVPGEIGKVPVPALDRSTVTGWLRVEVSLCI